MCTTHVFCFWLRNNLVFCFWLRNKSVFCFWLRNHSSFCFWLRNYSFVVCVCSSDYVQMGQCIHQTLNSLRLSCPRDRVFQTLNQYNTTIITEQYQQCEGKEAVFVLFSVHAGTVTDTCRHIHKDTHTKTNAVTHMHPCTCRQVHIHMHTDTQCTTHTHACTHTYTHTHTHTHTHAHTNFVMPN